MSYSEGEALAVAFATAGVEGLLNGIFFVLCTIALYLLIYRSPDRRPGGSSFSRNLPRPVVWGSILLLFIIMGHWSCTMARVVQMGKAIGEGLSVVHYLSWTADGLAIAKLSFLMLAGLVSDALMMWRLWVVSDRNRYILVPPTLAWLALLGAMMRVCAYYVQSRADQSLELSELSGAILAIGYSTILIRARSVFTNQDKLKVPTSQFLLIIIVEGAVVWSAWTLFTFVTYQTNSALMPLAFDGCPAAAGIAFMLINVRVGLGRDTNPTTLNIRRRSGGITSSDRITAQLDSTELSNLTLPKPDRAFVKEKRVGATSGSR
ncbi:hypothetical protein FA15DRAFT_744953 [Coprinopsis marcescibilis]|uniref:Uncharacterized protein n=1 Tax=Coprinopsis marcescibilis TaxID=230819 RepID=A0A5C3KTV4_COPMA|nr:hypothetical protein FA15DRAFT_744953 [Coprinopsis marcescibilis]